MTRLWTMSIALHASPEISGHIFTVGFFKNTSNRGSNRFEEIKQNKSLSQCKAWKSFWKKNSLKGPPFPPKM